MIKSLKGFSWNNFGPESQTAQNYISIRPKNLVIWVVALLATGQGWKRHPHDSAARRPSKHWTITQWCFKDGPASKTLGIETVSGWCHVFVGALPLGIQQTQCWSSVWPAWYAICRHWTSNGLRCWPNIERNWVGITNWRPTLCVRGILETGARTIHWQVLNVCWPAPRMVHTV